MEVCHKESLLKQECREIEKSSEEYIDEFTSLLLVGDEAVDHEVIEQKAKHLKEISSDLNDIIDSSKEDFKLIDDVEERCNDQVEKISWELSNGFDDFT